MSMFCRRVAYGVGLIALCLALSACNGGVDSSESPSSTAANQQPTVVVTQIEAGKDSEVQAGNNAVDVKDKKNEHNELSTCLGSIAEKAADDHGNPLVTKDTAREIFTFVIQDEEYKLPCPIKTFMATGEGWGFEQGFTFDDMQYDPGFSFDVGLWYEEDANYNVTVKLKNTTDEIVGWEDLSVIGISVKPMESYVSFESKAGIDRDSDLDKLLAVLGCNDESTLLENKTIVEYHVSLFEKPFYDMNVTLYGNVSYDWNKTGRVLTGYNFELLEPWDTDLLKTDEELEKEKEEKPKEEDEHENVGRTIEGV